MNTLKGAHGDENPTMELLPGEDEIQQAELMPAERVCPVLQHLPSAAMKNAPTKDDSDVMATGTEDGENDLHANHPIAYDSSVAQH
jgi:hypothetical protein